MAKKYRAKRELLFGILFSLAPLCTWIATLVHPKILLLCMAFIVTALFAWIWIGTVYLLKNGNLIYHSGPIRGRIPVSKIREIKQNVYSWVGIRPALSFRYIQIRYNKYNDLFIAPEMEEEFIQELISINPEITVINKKYNQALRSDG